MLPVLKISVSDRVYLMLPVLKISVSDRVYLMLPVLNMISVSDSVLDADNAEYL